MSDARRDPSTGSGSARAGSRAEGRDARPVRRSLGEGGFDAAIDGAVRELLDVEPPPGLRGRVLERIETTDPVASGFRWKAAWLAVPIAAAAMILLAVLGPWRQMIPPSPPAPSVVARAPQPVALPPEPPAPRPSTNSGRTPRPFAASPAPPRPRPERGVTAAVSADADVVWVDPLAPPLPLAVADIETVGVRAVKSIDVAPAEIPALQVRPISDTPRERRNQE